MEDLKQYLTQISQALAAVREVTGSVDERLKTLIGKIDGQEVKLDNLSSDVEQINERVSALETTKDTVTQIKETIKEVTVEMHRLEVKVAALEIHSQRHKEGRWRSLCNTCVTVVWAVAGILIIGKLGFSALTLP